MVYVRLYREWLFSFSPWLDRIEKAYELEQAIFIVYTKRHECGKDDNN